MGILRNLCFLIIMLMSIQTSAQSTVTLSAGYGMYAMGDLSRFQAAITSSGNAPVPLTQVSSFPPYINFEGSFMQRRKKLLTGISIGYGSTGARSGYSDYSGSVYIDQQLRYLSLLVSVGYTKDLEEGKWLLDFDLRPGIVLSFMDIVERSAIGSSTYQSSISFQSTNIVIQPAVSVTRRFSRYGVEALAGYQVSIVKGNLYLKGNSNAYLVDNNQSMLTSDWSGLRLSLGVSYFFPAKP